MASHLLQHLRASASRWLRLLFPKNSARPQPAALASANSDPDDPKKRYRDFNGWYFANFYEQERMLADRVRMLFYHQAVARHILPGDRVIDLGTGTGILAAFASRRGAAKVYAIDHSEILKHAITLARANAIENVEFIATHSSELTLEEPVDVILHEQMGDCLFDEAMIPNILDLRDRLLKPGGRILPARFELFCEPVQIRPEARTPFLWELNVHGFDYSEMEWHRPQHSEYYQTRSSDPGIIERFLAKPEPILSIDLLTLDQSTLARELPYQRVIVHSGQLDGFVVFFRAIVDDDLSLSTDPSDPHRASHWGLRILRCEQLELKAGDHLEIQLQVDDWSDLDTWRWRHVHQPAPESRAKPWTG